MADRKLAKGLAPRNFGKRLGSSGGLALGVLDDAEVAPRNAYIL